MPYIDIAEQVDTKLQAIWHDPRFTSFCHRPYMAPEKITRRTLLFIGINPSYTEEDLHIQYYDGSNSLLQYFRKFNDLAQLANMPWSHLDMLFYRETPQHSIKAILKEKNGVEFIWEQLQLAKKLLDDAKPTVIVVCNTMARKLLGKDVKDGQDEWLGLDFQWNEILGTYTYNSIPVFFSSMLSGQRALDMGSYERLAWQIRFVLKQMNYDNPEVAAKGQLI